MSGFFWNVRGFNKTRKHKVVRQWTSSASVLFGCLLETRVKESNAAYTFNSTFPGWDLLSNYEHHRLGRIWVVWNDKVVMTPVIKNSQMITCSVSIPEQSLYFYCSFVYASNFDADRAILWEDLRNHHSTPLMRTPWLIMGDFNEILTMDEHSALPSYVTSGTQDFQNFVNQCSITDLAAKGSKYTWSNKQVANPISKKLDRGILVRNDCTASIDFCSISIYKKTKGIKV